MEIAMAKKVSADSLIEQIRDLENAITEKTLIDIVEDLREALKSGPIEGDVDTWESGFRAAIETITANHNI